MVAAYAERLLRCTFTLGSTAQEANPTFGGTPSNQVQVSNYRTSVAIDKSGGASLVSCHLRIHGLSLAIMNRLSSLGLPIAFYQGRNILTVEAGCVEDGMATVFEGIIWEAWAALDQQPDTAFECEAIAGGLAQVATTTPTSFQGTADVATIMASLAAKSVPPLYLENHGVNVKLSNPYFSGSAINQIKQCADHAGIGYIIDGTRLAIWPADSSRNNGQIPLISPSTGLVGYPRFRPQGIAFRCLYNPSIDYGINVQIAGSQIAQANGTWTVDHLVYDLESFTSEGKWFIDVEAHNPAFPTGFKAIW